MSLSYAPMHEIEYGNDFIILKTETFRATGLRRSKALYMGHICTSNSYTDYYGRNENHLQKILVYLLSDFFGEQIDLSR